jgi:P-loop containing dynein motor region
MTTGWHVSCCASTFALCNHGNSEFCFAAAVSHTCLPAHPQEAIEAKLEKRTKGVYAPPGGRRLVAFIDDLNMPAKSKYGFMPPLELLKLWADNGFWCGPLDSECSFTTSRGRSSSREGLLHTSCIIYVLVCAPSPSTLLVSVVCAQPSACTHACAHIGMTEADVS